MADYDLPDWVARLRIALGDTTGPYLWDDPTLEQAIARATAAHSYHFPHLVAASYVISLAQQDIALAASADAGLIAVVAAELPVGTPIPRLAYDTTGPRPSTASRVSQGYWWRTETLRLRR